MTPETCLPADLQGPGTTITKIAAGLSGAGVYRVDAGGRAFVLKVASEAETDADWARALRLQRLAAEAGLSPRLVHVDEARRAVLSDFVVDRSFMPLFLDPRSREAALTLLGRTVRRIHALPVPGDSPTRDPRALLGQLSEGLTAGFSIPAFARDAIGRVLSEAPPARERDLVLGHCDLNPTNLVYDGERIILLDWAAAAVIDPDVDLATMAVFMRMDDPTCARLVSAYDDRPQAALTERFRWSRRVMATLAGSMQLFLARQMKHPGASGAEALETTPSLGEFYQRLRAGEFRMGTPEGQWAFGSSLLKESAAL